MWRRRHADVDDRDVDRRLVDRLEQRIGVADRDDDLEAAILQHPRDALAQQDDVLGYGDAHGNATSSRVPRLHTAVEADRTAQGGHPVLDPGQPGPVRGVGTAAAVVADIETELVIGEPRPDVDASRPGVLDGIGEASAVTK